MSPLRNWRLYLFALTLILTLTPPNPNPNPQPKPNPLCFQLPPGLTLIWKCPFDTGNKCPYDILGTNAPVILGSKAPMILGTNAITLTFNLTLIITLTIRGRGHIRWADMGRGPNPLSGIRVSFLLSRVWRTNIWQGEKLKFCCKNGRKNRWKPVFWCKAPANLL